MTVTDLYEPTTTYMNLGRSHTFGSPPTLGVRTRKYECLGVIDQCFNTCGEDYKQHL